MWLSSDNSWAWRRLKHLSWRSRWINYPVHTWTEIGRFTWNLTSWSVPFLPCSPDWTRDPPQLCDECSLPLRGCRTIVPILRIIYSRLSMLWSFQPSLEIHATAFVHHTALIDKRFVIQIHCSCEIFMILFNFY